MRTHNFAIAALVVSGALAINAQTPTSQPPGQQTGQRAGEQQRANAGDQQVTISGCLRAEKDVPGRTPNVAERAGVGEDYILTNVKMGQGSSTSGIGLAQMYKVEGLGDTELKKHLNHQVEVVGRLQMRGGTGMSGAGRGTTGGTTAGTTGGTAAGTTGGTTGGTTSGTTGGTTTGTAGGTTAGTTGRTTAGPGAELPEIEATSVRMVANTCQAQ
jgi:hypothetical protein